jgi:hypothetical protein
VRKDRANHALGQGGRVRAGETATMKIEAFITLLLGRSAITCSNPISLWFAGVVSVARCVLALSLPCIAACRASGSLGGGSELRLF